MLEEGKFHLGFFDDRLSMPDMYGRNHAHTVEHGIRCVKLDAVTVLTVMGMATERLGLGATYSTSYYEPFHVARLFATLDLMTEGRAAWNVVTSLNDGEAQNMGREEVIAHDERYDRADEFMAVVLGHWDSWEDDAIVQDKASGLFARPERVHRLDHQGRFFRSRGPFTVPRSPQGSPVIIQAGQSGRGRRFGAQWGELIFVVYPTIEIGKRDYADFKADVAGGGRDPDCVVITQLVNTVAAATRTEAEDKWAVIEKLPLEVDALSLLSEALNFDFARKGMDEPFTDAEMAEMSGLQAIRDRVVRASGKKNPTVREFIHFSGRGRVHDPVVGGPKDDCRSARAMVRRARLRRLRRVRHPRAWRLRGLRPLRRARAAAPRLVPQGVCGHDFARESRDAGPGGGGVEGKGGGLRPGFTLGNANPTRLRVA